MAKRKKRLRSPTELAQANHGIFKDAARRQLVCAGCGKGGLHFAPHHVVYEQHLRARSLPRYDARNALRLCAGPLGCHVQHHARADGKVIKTSALTDENIAYAFEALGPAAIDYLRRYYDDGAGDPRIAAREAELAA